MSRSDYHAGMRADTVDPEDLHRILVIKLRHHGDVLLTGPVFTALKHALPHAQVDGLVYLETADMLRDHPDVDTLHTIDRAWKKRGPVPHLRAEWGLLQTLRAQEYDLIVHLTEHARGALLTQVLQPRYSVAGLYPHKRGAVWRATFTHLYTAPLTPRHAIERNLDAIRRIGIYPPAEARVVKLIPGAAAEKKIADIVQTHHLGAGGFVVVHPGSRWLFKTWSARHMAELIDSLHSAGMQVALTGAPDLRERAMVADVLARLSKPAIDLAGQLSLKELAALIATAKCFIGVDSVPMHIAAAMGTPTVALFGPSGDIEWQPWRVPHRVVTSNHPCRPCGLEGCGNSHYSDCLAAITPQQVLAAVESLLAA